MKKKEYKRPSAEVFVMDMQGIMQSVSQGANNSQPAPAPSLRNIDEVLDDLDKDLDDFDEDDEDSLYI